VTAVVELEGVSLARRGQVVLEDVSLVVEPHECLALLGPNGSGKTTLLEVLLGRLTPQQGRVRVLGGSPEQARGRVGYVPQHAHFDRDFPIRVLDVALTGRLARRRSSFSGPRSRATRKRDAEAARSALLRVGIESLELRPIAALSGGELQRVLIARALAAEPELLLLDEPTSHLDERGDASVWDLLAELASDMSVIVVSHDVGTVSRRVRRVACLNRRLHVHDAADLTPELLESIYGGPVNVLAHGHDHGGGQG